MIFKNLQFTKNKCQFFLQYTTSAILVWCSWYFSSKLAETGVNPHSIMFISDRSREKMHLWCLHWLQRSTIIQTLKLYLQHTNWLLLCCGTCCSCLWGMEFFFSKFHRNIFVWLRISSFKNERKKKSRNFSLLKIGCKMV